MNVEIPKETAQQMLDQLTKVSEASESVKAAADATAATAATVGDVVKEVGEKAIGVAGSAYRFAIDQLPDVLHQIVAWHLAYHLAFMVGCFITMIAIYMVFNRNLKKDYIDMRKKYENKESVSVEDENTALTVSIFGFALHFANFLVFMDSLTQAAQIAFAPKVFLIEYLSRLVK